MQRIVKGINYYNHQRSFKFEMADASEGESGFQCRLQFPESQVSEHLLALNAIMLYEFPNCVWSVGQMQRVNSLVRDDAPLVSCEVRVQTARQRHKCDVCQLLFDGECHHISEDGKDYCLCPGCYGVFSR